MDTYLTWTLYNIWHRWFGLSSVNQSSLASVILHSGDGSSFSAHPLIVNCNPLIAIFFMILLHLILHTWWCHSFKASSTTHRREGSKMCISTFLLDFFSLDCSSGTPYLTLVNWKEIHDSLQSCDFSPKNKSLILFFTSSSQRPHSLLTSNLIYVYLQAPLKLTFPDVISKPQSANTMPDTLEAQRHHDNTLDNISSLYTGS